MNNLLNGFFLAKKKKEKFNKIRILNRDLPEQFSMIDVFKEIGNKKEI